MDNNKIKRIVEQICVGYTRESLEYRCGFYYELTNRKVSRAKRCDLEQIAFIIMSLSIYHGEKYRVYTASKVIYDAAPSHKVIDYIFRKTIYAWYDEPEYPITRDLTQDRVYVERVN